jgi:parallel beta-helix repeat protein
MATLITKNSSTAASVPGSGDLVQGELAVNVADKRLFTKNASGTVVEVGTNPSALTVASSVTAASFSGPLSNLQFTQAGTGAVARTAQSKLRDVVSVKDFGAVGDGVTDDTAAIETCIAAAGVGATIVFAPGMNCLLASELDLTVSGQRLIGYGATLTKAGSFTGSGMIRCAATNVTVEGFTFNGTDKTKFATITSAGAAEGFTVLNNVVYNCSYGITANSNSRIRIENNRVYQVANYAIWVQNITGTSAYTNVRVVDNNIDMSDLGSGSTQLSILVRGDAAYPTTNVYIAGNNIVQAVDPASSSALCCECRFVDNGVFQGNTCTNGSMVVSAASCNSFTIDNNVGTNQTFYGIEVAALSGYPMQDIVVSNNTLRGSNILNYAIGLQGFAASNRCSITGNSISATVNFGIYVTDQWDNVSITGNTIDISTSGSAQYGIYMLGSTTSQITHVAITGNQINGNAAGEKGIYLRNVSFASVTGNEIFNWTEDPVFLYVDSTVISITGNALTPNGVNIGKTVLGTLGNRVVAYGNAGYRLTGTIGANIQNYNLNLYEAWGTGTPEGAVTAGVGSIYRRTDGGANTCLYIKESGTGNTGWVAK